MEVYDTIGRGYGELRRADPRIAARLTAALGPARSVVNVGAGAGSYEPRDRALVAVEPSRVMLRQRPSSDVPAVRGSGSALPFVDDAFEAALAILTIHHWPDLAAGLEELRRVARDRVVILTFDSHHEGFWLLDYLPEIREVDRAWMPPIGELTARLGACRVETVPVPHDCTDGFLGAYWRRPGAYLDARRRAAISVFSKLRDGERGLARLRDDLESGAWRRRYGELLERDALDVGYRLVVAHAEAHAGTRDAA